MEWERWIIFLSALSLETCIFLVVPSKLQTDGSTGNHAHGDTIRL